MTEAADGRARVGKEARAAVMGRVWEERDRQDALFPEQAPDRRLGPAKPHTMLAVLTEEVGEVAKATLEADHAGLCAELVQTAAVCVKWLEILDGSGGAEEIALSTARELGAAITDPGEADDESRWG